MSQTSPLQAAAAGPQTDTAHFAGWEGTTRGIGSKLLAGMGYVKGLGLGRSRLGMANPLAVRKQLICNDLESCIKCCCGST